MPAPFHWTEEKRKEMIAAYNNGEGIISIAKRFHVRHESISALLQEQGIQVKTRSEWSRRNICNYAYFHRIDTEEKAYWLGFLTAARAMGLAKHDFAIVFKVLAKMAGLDD